MTRTHTKQTTHMYVATTHTPQATQKQSMYRPRDVIGAKISLTAALFWLTITLRQPMAPPLPCLVLHTVLHSYRWSAYADVVNTPLACTGVSCPNHIPSVHIAHANQQCCPPRILAHHTPAHQEPARCDASRCDYPYEAESQLHQRRQRVAGPNGLAAASMHSHVTWAKGSYLSTRSPLSAATTT